MDALSHSSEGRGRQHHSWLGWAGLLGAAGVTRGPQQGPTHLDMRSHPGLRPRSSHEAGLPPPFCGSVPSAETPLAQQAPHD